MSALGLGDQRAHGDGLVEGVAEDDALGALGEAVEEGVVEAALDEDAGGVGADLAGGVEVAEHGAADGRLEVGVVEDQQRGLAAELEGDRLEAGGGGRVDAAAGGDRAGQRDLGDLGVGGEGGAGGAVALDDREGAGGEAGLGEDLAELEGAERGELGGLEDQGVAAGEGAGRPSSRRSGEG